MCITSQITTRLLKLQPLARTCSSLEFQDIQQHLCDLGRSSSALPHDQSNTWCLHMTEPGLTISHQCWYHKTYLSYLFAYCIALPSPLRHMDSLLLGAKGVGAKACAQLWCISRNDSYWEKQGRYENQAKKKLWTLCPSPILINTGAQLSASSRQVNLGVQNECVPHKEAHIQNNPAHLPALADGWPLNDFPLHRLCWGWLHINWKDSQIKIRNGGCQWESEVGQCQWQWLW